MDEAVEDQDVDKATKILSETYGVDVNQIPQEQFDGIKNLAKSYINAQKKFTEKSQEGIAASGNVNLTVTYGLIRGKYSITNGEYGSYIECYVVTNYSIQTIASNDFGTSSGAANTLNIFVNASNEVVVENTSSDALKGEVCIDYMGEL